MLLIYWSIMLLAPVISKENRTDANMLKTKLSK